MAKTVTAFIRVLKSTDKNKLANIRFRLRDGRNVQLFHKSEILVIPDKWDDKQQKVKARCLIDEMERLKIDTGVSSRKKIILNIYAKYLKDGKTIDSDLLNIEIDKILHPERHKVEEPTRTIFEHFDEYLEKKDFPKVTVNNFMVLKRAMQRFEIITSKQKVWELDKITVETLENFERFLKDEHLLYNEHREIYNAIPLRKNTRPQQRGQNSIYNLVKKLRMFLNWCIKNDKTNNNPFKKYALKPPIYGTPIYITIEERNQIFDTHLSHRPFLAIQRDIFVFQCLIGCRISDLYKLTKASVINNAIEYIPKKTKEDKPITIRVPLNTTAKEILNRYADFDGNMLFPYISEQKYNDAIKEIFTISGITRTVTVLNPTTRNEEKRPINEIASSHLARRTFIGNLYEKVKDPQLIAPMSGHSDNSRAFARYRDTNKEEIKIELVNLLV